MEIWKPIFSIWRVKLALPLKSICVVKSRVCPPLQFQGSSMMKHHYIFLVILLAISEYLISGAPTTAYISLPADDALSTYSCIDSAAWSGPSFYPRNCATAISQFFVQEVIVHGDADFEFQGVGAHAQSRYPSQMTPQKFTYGELSCISLQADTRDGSVHAWDRNAGDG